MQKTEARHDERSATSSLAAPSALGSAFALDGSIAWSFESLEAERGVVPFEVAFKDPLVEKEYLRFVHSADYKTVVFFTTLLGPALIIGASLLLASQRNPALVVITAGSWITVCGVVELVLCVVRRAATIDEEHQRVRRHLAIQPLCWGIFAVLFFGVLGPMGRYCERPNPRFTTADDVCDRSLRGGQFAALICIAAFMRNPARAIPMLGACVGLQFLAFAGAGQGDAAAILFRVAMTALVAAVGMFGVWNRDASQRQYFADIVAIEAAGSAVKSQRHELGAIVKEAVPVRLLSRLSTESGGATAASLAALRDRTKHGLVCLVSPSNFDRLTTLQSLRRTICDVHILFTRLDAASVAHSMDRAPAYGDTYVVTSGLLGPPEHLRVLRFVRDALSLVDPRSNSASGVRVSAAHDTVALRAVISCGELQGCLAGQRDTMAYLVRGEAVDVARGIINAVPPRQCWMDADAQVVAASQAARRAKDIASTEVPIATETTHPGFVAVRWERVFSHSLVAPAQEEDSSSGGGSTLGATQQAAAMVALFFESSSQLVRPTTDFVVDLPPAANPLTPALDTINPSDQEPTAQAEALPPGGLHALPPTVISTPRYIAGVFTEAADEQDYQRDVREGLVRDGAYLFSGVFLMAFAVVAMAAVERLAVPGRSYGNSVAVDVVFFTMHGLVAVVSAVLGPLALLVHGTPVLGDRHAGGRVPPTEASVEFADIAGAPTTGRGQYEAGITQNASIASVTSALRDAVVAPFVQFAPNPIAGVILCDADRIVVALLVLTMVAVSSLFALQRSVITNAPYFLSIYAFAMTTTVLRGWRWYAASAAALCTCMLPVLGLLVYHVAPSTTMVMSWCACTAVAVLGSRMGCQAGRDQFVAQQIATVTALLYRNNARFLTRVAQQQMPAHVSVRGLAALRRNLKDTAHQLAPSRLEVSDFFGDFFCMSIRFVSPSGPCDAMPESGLTPVETVLRALDRTGRYSDPRDRLSFLQAVGDEVCVGGPFTEGDMRFVRCVDHARRVLHYLTRALPRTAFVAAAVVEEAVGAIVGARSLRYRLYGLATWQCLAILEAASSQVPSTVASSAALPAATNLVTPFRALYTTRRVRAALRETGGESHAKTAVTPFLSYIGQAIWRIRGLGCVAVHVHKCCAEPPVV